MTTAAIRSMNHFESVGTEHLDLVREMKRLPQIDQEVLYMAAEMYRAREIAAALEISVRTVMRTPLKHNSRGIR
jgi:DNA-directed RNA polymerase specialized sigma24 family protein